MYNNTIGKKKKATFYRTASRNKKVYSNYKLQKMMKIFLTKYSSPNTSNFQRNNFYQQQSNKNYSQYIINNFNYLLKQSTRHTTNYKLSVAPNLRKISLEKLHSGIPIEQLRASKNDVYKNENIDNNKTYLNEYMFRDENNNWVIKKNNDLTREDKINIINRDNQWYRQQIKDAHEKQKATNPFLSELTYQQAREQICAESDKLKAEYQSFIKTKYSANSHKTQARENNSLVDKFNTHYEKNKGDPPKLSEEELEQLLVELDNLD